MNSVYTFADHFAHSLNYLNIAHTLKQNRYATSSVIVGVPPGVSTIKVKQVT